MTRQTLKKKLEIEVVRWSAKTFGEVAVLKFPVVYETGPKGQADYYSTEVTVLERDAENVTLAISVDDGGVSAFVPATGTITISR